MERRGPAAVLALAAALQAVLTALRLPAWPCAFLQVTGHPCPGCGLSRAVAALVRADWAGAMAWHAFSPLAAGAGLLMLAAAVLPASARRRLAASVSAAERRTALAPIAAGALLVYWIARLLYTPLALPLR
jgi:hypothetical protein